MDAEDSKHLTPAASREVRRLLQTRADHRETPLVSLPELADELQVGALQLKDESHRLGLQSFKALGGWYAVTTLVLEEAARRLGRSVSIEDLGSAQIRDVAASMTFACATDGNHGRSVAAAARLVGAQSRVFVHAGVSAQRRAAIEQQGAVVQIVAGSYDDSVDEANRMCAANGWLAVSDMSWPGYEAIPRLILQGYTVLVQEALARLVAPPTHVFVQAGVGGLAAAVAGHLALVFGHARPVVVVVEPDRAACIVASAGAGRRTKIDPAGATVMSMLECYEPSLVAWRILTRTADAFMSIADEAAIHGMRRLARPLRCDPRITAGESGAAGLAGLMVVAADRGQREALGLTRNSRVLVVNTEGATDPVLYQQFVGLAPQAPTQA